MRIVISCSSQDHSLAELLGARLQQAGLEVWLYRDLTAGQAWWDTILAQLRSCGAVVVGVSRAYLNSRACRAERAYAESLGKPVLPVVIEPIDAAMLPPDLARLQFVDYSRQDEAAAFRLIGAILALPATRSLPDPLPAPPPIPVSYLSALAARLTSPSLSLDDQLEIIDMLEGAVNAAAPDDRRDATELLRELARRPDLYARAARRIESLLEPDDAANRPSESFDRLYGGHPAVDAGGTGMPPDPAPPRGTAGPKLVDFDMAGNEVEWATPVVYLRSPDGRVFRKDPGQPRQGTEPAADNAAPARHQPAQSQEPEAGEAKVFISYSHRDTRYRQQLQTHLSALRRQGVLAEWHDHKILPGEEWRDAIDRNLDAADCVVLLVTPDFIASDYCYSIEMDRALAKHREGRGLVIPVIVRPADWQHTPLSDLEALPEGAKPVVEWASRDRAWLSVADGVRLALASSARAKPGRKARGGDTREAQDDADLALLEQQARSSGQGGNAASARDQYAALLPAYERILGPQHPETLKARGSLARWTGRAGDLASGRDQYAALLPAYERVLGPEHPETLNTRNSLAWFTGHAGDPAGARDQLAALLPTDERVLGPEHAYTLAARNNLAHFTGAAGDPASARDQYAALVPVMERVLGPDHPETIAAGSSLADWSARTRSGHDDPTEALEREAASSRSQREIAALKEFDVPADKGLTRVQASEALKRHGIDPKAFGSWVRHGWVIRDGDRRYLSPKGRQWLTDHQTSP